MEIYHTLEPQDHCGKLHSVGQPYLTF